MSFALLLLATLASCSNSTPAATDGFSQVPDGPSENAMVPDQRVEVPDLVLLDGTWPTDRFRSDIYVPLGWASSLGGAGDDENGYVATDWAGNTYVTGSFVGSMTLGTTTLTSRGSLDLFVAKYSPTGVLLWAISGGGALDDVPMGIAVDGNSDAYVIGTHNSLEASYGQGSIKLKGGYDAFLVKVSETGSFDWVVSMGGAGDDVLYGVTTDRSSGNVYATGYFYGTAAFGSTNLSAKGFCDACLTVFAPDGQHRWTVAAGGMGWERGFAIAVSPAGEAYWTGQFAGDDIVVGSTTLKKQGEADIFVAKLASNGQFLWATSAGGLKKKEGNALGITCDAAGNSYITGMFEDQYTFGSSSVTAMGLVDAFVAKLKPSGEFDWVTSFGGNGKDLGVSIAADIAGSLYVTGGFQDVMTLRSATGASAAATLLSKGQSDVFVAALSPQGKVQWAASAGGTGSDEGQMIVVDLKQQAYVSGHFEATATFGNQTLSSKGKKDIFLWRLPLSASSISDGP